MKSLDKNAKDYQLENQQESNCYIFFVVAPPYSRMKLKSILRSFPLIFFLFVCFSGPFLCAKNLTHDSISLPPVSHHISTIHQLLSVSLRNVFSNNSP